MYKIEDSNKIGKFFLENMGNEKISFFAKIYPNKVYTQIFDINMDSFILNIIEEKGKLIEKKKIDKDNIIEEKNQVYILHLKKELEIVY